MGGGQRRFKMGNLLLNWGILAVGLLIFIFGVLFIVQFARAYKSHVMRHGRVKFGKEYGKDWEKADTAGVSGMIIIWIFIIPLVIGALLFFFTGLTEIGIPLWIGTTLGIAGVILFFMASIGGMGVAGQDAEIAHHNYLENEEQHEEKDSE